MNIFSRVSDIINANISDLLDRAEDPGKMVKMLIFEMQEQLGLAREGVAKAIAGEKKLAANLAKNREEAASWHARAEAAIGHGNEDLARKCLARKKDFEAIADSLQPQWQRARQTSDSLKADLRRIEEKLSEAIRRRDSLMARQMAAEAQQEMQRIAPTMTRVQNSFDKFARMERRIEDMEADAAALEELADISSDLGREVEQETKSAEVELELASLKMKVASKQSQ